MFPETPFNTGFPVRLYFT